MAQRLVYHWKHGWIPLDHYAALSKAHGRESGASKIEGRLGITGEDGKSHHLERHLQTNHTVSEPAAPVKVKRGDLVVVKERRSSFTLGSGISESNDYHVARVLSASREGVAKEVEHTSFGSTVKKKIDPRVHQVLVVGGNDKIDVSAAMAAAAQNEYPGHPGQSKPFESLEAAKAAIRPHVKAASPVNPVGKDARSMTPAQKIQAAAIMFGTNSSQYKAALKRFGGKSAA